MSHKGPRYATTVFAALGLLNALPLAGDTAARTTPRQIPGTLAALCRVGRTSAGPQTRVMILSGGVWRSRADLDARSIRWSPDGVHLILTGGDTGSILALAAAGSEPPWKAADAQGPHAFAPDGGLLAFGRAGGVALADMRVRTTRDVPGAERGYAPTWHPDGRRITFARAVGGSGSIWTTQVDGGSPERIAVCARPLCLAWSPDGSRLAVVEYDPDHMTLPRLGAFKPGDMAPTPICDVRGADVRWIGNDTVLVTDPSGAAVRVHLPTGKAVPAAAPSDRVLAASDAGASLAALILDAQSRPTAIRIGDGGTAVPVPPLPANLTVLDAAWTSRVLSESTPPRAPNGTDGRNQSEPDQAVVGPVGERHVVAPMVFPVCGPVTWTNTFGHPRGPSRRHAGQDIMAPKMRPVVAAFDGIVTLRRAVEPGGHNWLILTGDNGWTATYLHLNNDTPGTDDGLGTELYAFAPGLTTGRRVRAGQLLGYVGDSGNAENTAPHLHFELAPTSTRIPIDPGPSLELAERLDEPRTFDGPDA